jgi:hypothetical protein
MKTLEQIVAQGPDTGNAADAAPEEESHFGPDATRAGDAPDGHLRAENDAEPAGEARDRMVPVGALIDERRKRRAAEERLARQGHEGGEGPGAGGAGFKDDPDRYLTALKAELAGEIAAVRVDAAEAAARTRHADFAQKATAFAAVARGEPALVAAMQAAPDPAEFAYRLGARMLAGLAGESALPESLSDSPSAVGPAARPWRPKPLSDIVGRR